MSKLETPGQSVSGSLARLLDETHLVRLVPHLPAEMLHQLIRHSGLEACGELVASATPPQLTSILDLDLWRYAQPGREEEFDEDRFGEWVELLVDTGESIAARIVAGLDERLVTAGLTHYVRVFDPPAIAAPASEDAVLIDSNVTAPAVFECAVGGYQVSAIRPDAWDAIVALLLALHAEYPDRFQALMRGCRGMSNSTPEIDGLDELLTVPQQLLHDVAVERENRRSQQGYTTPADARAFLEMARGRTRQRQHGGPLLKTNPIVAAYFRAAGETAASLDPEASHAPPALPTSTGESADAIDAMIGLLADAGLVLERPRALLDGAGAEPSRLTRIRPLMEHVRDVDDHAYFTRTREMAFLANTLMAGCSVQSRPFTGQEASDAVVGICNLGLEHWPARWPDTVTRAAASTLDSGAAVAENFLVTNDLVTAFEVGWAVLHGDVSMFVATQLIATLKDLHCDDAETRNGLRALRRELVKQRAAGTPWRARPALEVIAILDTPSWATLLGLMGECPVLPAALRAILEVQTGPVSATAFEFISTTGQIGEVREFMRRLPHALRG